MAILNNNPLIGSGSNQGYNINNSLRFRSSASAYLSRTPASAGNRQVWTWSGWIKRGTLGGASNVLFNCYNTASSTQTSIQFENDTFVVFSNDSSTVNINLVSTQVFRDPSAWYHFVIAFDTTQATSSNRIKIYVNGSQITTFSTSTYPSLNYNGHINTTSLHTTFATRTPSGLTDGYLAENNFIDGSAKTPSDFGETDTTTGVWKPKAYSGTYGTNGFYLKFSDIATTSGSNAGLGKDFSGNSNYWTTNNISVTSGTTYDAMTDVPTNTSATVANYAVLNPLQVASATLSNANLSMVRSAAGYGETSSTFSPEGNKGYFEITRSSTGDHLVGFILNSVSPSTNNYTASGSYWYQCDTGNVRYGTGGSTAALITGCTSAPTGSQIIMVAFDFTGGNRNVWFGLQGTWGVNASSQTGVPSTGAFPHLTTTQLTDVCRLYFSNGDANTFSINFGQRPFSYTPPTGYVALNTFNLPTSTIVKGSSYMQALLYTGNGTNNRTVTGVGFNPSLTWVKSRSLANSNVLADSVRGTNANIYSNLTNAETAPASSGGGGIGQVTTDGFTLVQGTVGFDNSNGNGATYVAWNWLAGTSTSSNTSGSITSTVSVNTTAGFSIVTYTGNSTAGATIGHGLGVAPKMIIVKTRNAIDNWAVYHSSIGATQYLQLNNTNASASSITLWNDTSPTSTVFSVGTNNDVNDSARTYVAYCWAEIAGFSRFGSYTGNSSTDGPFIYTGFRPKFVLFKISSGSTGNWSIVDTSRSTYNEAVNLLNPDTSDAAADVSPFIDILSNGIKIRRNSVGLNNSGYTYIYAAFAENPFKNSLAR